MDDSKPKSNKQKIINKSNLIRGAELPINLTIMTNLQTLQAAAQRQFLLENNLDFEYRTGLISEEDYELGLKGIFKKISTLYGI